MDPVTKAILQLRVVLVTYRQLNRQKPGDGEAAAAFRDRARPLLDTVESICGSDPEVAQVLAEVRGELDRLPAGAHASSE